jgi:hypothetical protein
MKYNQNLKKSQKILEPNTLIKFPEVDAVDVAHNNANPFLYTMGLYRPQALSGLLSQNFLSKCCPSVKLLTNALLCCGNNCTLDT